MEKRSTKLQDLIMTGTNQLEMKLHEQSEKIVAALSRIEKLEHDLENLERVLHNEQST